MSLWSRSARPSTKGTPAAWGRTKPFSISTTSRSICTWSRGTWSTWSSAALRSGPEQAEQQPTRMRNQLTELSFLPRIQPRRRWSAPSCPPCPPAYPPFISSSLSSSSRSCFSATSCTSKTPLIGPKRSVFHLIRRLDGVCTFPPAGVNKKQLQRNSFDEIHLWNLPANEGVTLFTIEFVWFFRL